MEIAWRLSENMVLRMRGCHARVAYAIFILCLTVIIALLGGCSRSEDYRVFSEEGVGFIFEYPQGQWPNGWLVTPVYRSSDSWYIGLLGPDPADLGRESSIKVSIDVWLGLGPKAEQKAQDILSEHVEAYERTPNFKIVRQENVILDRQIGYLVEYTHDFDTSFFRPPGQGFLLPTRVLNIATPRDGKVYQILVLASQNEWNTREKDIQHILDTFKWK
jgi:hypothetical protein